MTLTFPLSWKCCSQAGAQETGSNPAWPCCYVIISIVLEMLQPGRSPGNGLEPCLAVLPKGVHYSMCRLESSHGSWKIAGTIARVIVGKTISLDNDRVFTFYEATIPLPLLNGSPGQADEHSPLSA